MPSKKLTIKLAKASVFVYHLLFPSRVKTCRYEPTCSKYLIEALEKYGTTKGSQLFIRRFGACHPFSNRPLIDPLP